MTKLRIVKNAGGIVHKQAVVSRRSETLDGEKG